MSYLPYDRELELKFQVLEREGTHVDEGKLRRVINLCGFSDYADEIVQQVRPSVWIHPERTTSIPKGQSKFGGLPDLPFTVDYPTYLGKPLGFVAQINVTDIPDCPAKLLLPPQGILCFFTVRSWNDQHELSYEQWSSRDSARVLYYDGQTLPSEMLTLPDLSGMYIYPECKLRFEPFLLKSRGRFPMV